MAKKTAKKKTAAPKKKAAKRGAPTKNCPKCNNTLHAAKAACDCGYKFPSKRKKKKKHAKRAVQTVAATGFGDGTLSRKLAESIKIVQKAGGLDQAKQMLDAVKELERIK